MVNPPGVFFACGRSESAPGTLFSHILGVHTLFNAFLALAAVFQMLLDNIYENLIFEIRDGFSLFFGDHPQKGTCRVRIPPQ